MKKAMHIAATGVACMFTSILSQVSISGIQNDSHCGVLIVYTQEKAKTLDTYFTEPRANKIIEFTNHIEHQFLVNTGSGAQIISMEVTGPDDKKHVSFVQKPTQKSNEKRILKQFTFNRRSNHKVTFIIHVKQDSSLEFLPQNPPASYREIVPGTTTQPSHEETTKPQEPQRRPYRSR
jgi:hypothetical protein